METAGVMPAPVHTSITVCWGGGGDEWRRPEDTREGKARCAEAGNGGAGRYREPQHEKRVFSVLEFAFCLFMLVMYRALNAIVVDYGYILE